MRTSHERKTCSRNAILNEYQLVADRRVCWYTQEVNAAYRLINQLAKKQLTTYEKYVPASCTSNALSVPAFVYQLVLPEQAGTAVWFTE